MTDRIKWGSGPAGGPTRRQRFIEFARHELNRARSAREPLEKRWRDWLELYRAPQTDSVAHYPFEGASARTFPLAAMNVDPIWADYMSNIHAPDNLWTTKALNERWIEKAKPVQDFLSWIEKNILRMWNVNMRVFPEMFKLGTSVYKTSWRFEQRNVTGYDAEMNRTRLVRRINQPVVDPVSIFDFYVPPEANDIDPDEAGGAAWKAERHRIRPLALEAMAKGQEPFLPRFDPAATKRVLTQHIYQLTDHQAKVKALDSVNDDFSTLSEMAPIELFEIHARFDTSGNGIEDDIIVIFHEPTGEILQATYDWTPGTYSVVRYLRGDGFYGIGICEQCEMWQGVTSQVMNFDIDRMLLANAPMLAVAEGANVLPDEPIFGGKIWQLANPKEDIVPFHLTDGNPIDVLSMLNFLIDGSRNRTGVSELQQGTIQGLPSRTPATTVQSLLQEGRTRFDMSMKDLRKGGLADVGLRVLQHLQFQTQNFRNNPFAQAYLQAAVDVLGMPEGRHVVEALRSLPGEAIETGVGVELTATSGANNKELQRQSSLALLNLGATMGERFIQLASLVQQGGPVGQTAAQLFQAGTELFLRTLEQFEVRNPEELVPNLRSILGATDQLSGMASGPLARGGQGAQGNGGVGGLPGVP